MHKVEMHLDYTTNRFDAQCESNPFKADEHWHGNWAVNARFNF